MLTTSAPPFNRKAEPIADTAFSLDGMRRARVGFQLSPQPQDLHVDAAIEDVLVDTRRLLKVLAGQRAPWCVQEGNQEAILTLSQGDLHSRWIEKAPIAPIESPASETEAAGCLITRQPGMAGSTATEHCADPREQFPEPEWLHDIVVGAELQSDDTLSFAAG